MHPFFFRHFGALPALHGLWGSPMAKSLNIAQKSHTGSVAWFMMTETPDSCGKSLAFMCPQDCKTRLLNVVNAAYPVAAIS
ncbi:hypothetical protein EV426DRAFT_579474 [Tirmania nivea]|nr:hypothetical protein EV426DRAFT_579474 [Tirmania nivea]